MFGFIRSISFSVQVMIPILGLILFAVAWFLPGNMQPGEALGNGFYYLPKDGWLYTQWIQMAGLPLWAQLVPSYLIAFTTSLLLVRNDMKNLLMSRRSYAMAIVFLFLLGSGGHYFIFHPAFVSGLLMVLSHRYLLNLYKKETDYSIVFMIGLTWGTAVLIYPPLIILTPAILYGMLVMVSAGWRHWMVVLMGMTIPALLTGASWYLLGDLDYEVQTFLSWFKIRHAGFPVFIRKEPFIAAWLGLVLIWIIVASTKYRNPKIQSRQLFQTNFLQFLFTVIIAVFMETVSVEFIWVMIIPLSYMMTFWALEVRKGWVRDLFFLSLLISFAFFRFRGLM
jgi:hypothetical protein